MLRSHERFQVAVVGVRERPAAWPGTPLPGGCSPGRAAGLLTSC